MKTSLFIMLLSIITLMLSSCYFTATNPMTESPSIQTDDALLGMWKAMPLENDKKDEDNYLMILKDQAGWLRIILLENKSEYSEEYIGFISIINNEGFLNVKAVRTNETDKTVSLDKTFTFAHYKITKNKLIMRLLNNKTIEKMITTKRLIGSIDKSSTLINDMSKNIEKQFTASTIKELLDDQILIKATKINY